MKKREIFEKILAALGELRDTAEKAREAAQKEANSHVGAMESRYDTFKEEAQYEAAAQEKRTVEYRNGMSLITALMLSSDFNQPSTVARVGTIVRVVNDSEEQKHYILSPSGGGVEVSHEGINYFTLTPESPLGKEIIGREIGDEIELKIRKATITYSIEEIF